jgi:hypothetical protein
MPPPHSEGGGGRGHITGDIGAINSLITATCRLESQTHNSALIERSMVAWLCSVPHGGSCHCLGSAAYLMEGPSTGLARQRISWRALPLSWLGSIPHGGPCHCLGSAAYLMEGPATGLSPQCITWSALPLSWLGSASQIGPCQWPGSVKYCLALLRT